MTQVPQPRHTGKTVPKKLRTVGLALTAAIAISAIGCSQANEPAPEKDTLPPATQTAPADNLSGSASEPITPATGTSSGSSNEPAANQQTETMPPVATGDQPPTTTSTDPADWNLRLVNTTHLLPADFSVELTSLKNGHHIDARAYQDLQEMMDAARAEGLAPLICSSYRSMEKQTQLYEKKTKFYLDQGYSEAEAKEQASFWVAVPGTSEHQSGLALDIVATSYQMLDKGQEDTAEQKWLMANCQNYGFILRYPSDKSEITGVGYEPWHYRYVGKEAAQEIMSQGLCLEEYLGQI